MTANIFPGLSEPKSKLYFDLQAMIAREGGRLNLARRIESEQTHIFRPRYVPPHSYLSFNKAETDFMIENFKNMTSLKISNHLKRNPSAVRYQIHKMQRHGLIDYKLKKDHKTC